jgi:hypothetical protein
MKILTTTTIVLCVILRLNAQTHHASSPDACGGVDAGASQALQHVGQDHDNNTCHVHSTQDGYIMPDPGCTPGAINPTVTEQVIKDTGFTTKCVRNRITTEHEKAQTYNWYAITHPTNNTGASQSCELDHLVPLYLGGADTLDNIWPQCGPARVSLENRYFKKKDKVEYYLGQMVRQGKMNLKDAQNGIAADWTQYLKDAEDWCGSNKCTFDTN